ncbi:hypothetical protein HK101_002109, partial [Irineochytrium annulatum]
MAPTSPSTPLDVLRRHAREAIIAGCGCLIFLSFLLYPQSADPRCTEPRETDLQLSSQPVPSLVSKEVENSTSTTPARKCNLYDHSGRLLVPFYSWTPLGPTPPGCEAERARAESSPASLDRLTRLADSSVNGGRLPDYLSNKLLLVVGDSNDRNTVEDLCWNIAGSLQYHYADGSQISDEVRGTGMVENMGDSMSCVIRPGKGYTNWMEAKEREEAIKSQWDKHVAERAAREGGASRKLEDMTWKKRDAAQRRVVSANH